MNKYLLLILIIISTLAQSEQKIITLLNDPFAVPKYVPCTDLESQLISQLSLWQFRGYIADHDMGNSMKIFLQSSKTKTWLAISTINNTLEFLPWQINKLSPNEIHWKAELPKYCRKQLVTIMKLQGE